MGGLWSAGPEGWLEADKGNVPIIFQVLPPLELLERHLEQHTLYGEIVQLGNSSHPRRWSLDDIAGSLSLLVKLAERMHHVQQPGLASVIYTLKQREQHHRLVRGRHVHLGNELGEQLRQRVLVHFRQSEGHTDLLTAIFPEIVVSPVSQR